jgi:tRNA(fMet)-specific endonuclease VapC
MVTISKVIIDTNIVSYIMKGRPEAQAYIPHLTGKLVAVSFITVGELYFGAEKDNWGPKKRLQLETMLKNFIVIPYDHKIAKIYGFVMAERRRIGRQISCCDAWVASCALRHNIPLVTHNARDFELIPKLQLITERNP